MMVGDGPRGYLPRITGILFLIGVIAGFSRRA